MSLVFAEDVGVSRHLAIWQFGKARPEIISFVTDGAALPSPRSALPLSYFTSGAQQFF